MLTYYSEEYFLGLRYAELLKLNRLLNQKSYDQKRHVRILSNITVNQLQDPLLSAMRLSGVDATVTPGNYDNIFQDSLTVEAGDVVIVFWEVCNLVPDFHKKVDGLTHSEFNDIIHRAQVSLGAVIKNLSKASLVIFNEFTSAVFNASTPAQENLSRAARLLNGYLFSNVSQANLVTVDLHSVFNALSVRQSADLRFYALGKALYTFEFFKYYCNEILPYINAVTGRTKKALVLDCDNTIWKGILGEDGFDKIEMSPTTAEGAVYHEIQSIARLLAGKGVIIGLCSKNNAHEVEKVLADHPGQLLRHDDISVVKCNWQEKSANLVAIAAELNIGLDSIVFVDDSPYEIEFVRQNLPMIDVLSVPENLFEFPLMLRRKARWFWRFAQTEEDRNKASQYKQQSLRLEFLQRFSTLQEYLKGLELEVEISRNKMDEAPRVAQLCQKTNQFNVRPVRYTEQDIFELMNDGCADVFALSVSDKFGDNGLTGVCVVRYSADDAFLDSFLLSCRIIGRHLEFQFMQFVLSAVKESGVKQVRAEYQRTERNGQVADFFEQCSFANHQETPTGKTYRLDIGDWSPSYLEYIKFKQQICLTT